MKQVKPTLSMLTQSLAEAMAQRFDDFVASGARDEAALKACLTELVQVEDFFARGHLTPDARAVALDLIARAHDWIRDQGLTKAYQAAQKAAQQG